MLRYFQSLSGVLFYLLGSSVFLAHLLRKNAMWPEGAEQWMLSIILPLLLCGLLYGGTSLYLSVQGASGRSTGLAAMLACVTLFIFSIFAILTFWPL